VILLLLMHYFQFYVALWSDEPLCVINYRKRNIDLLVIHFALKQNLVTSTRDPRIVIPGSQLARLRFFHVIAKLIFIVFNRHAEIPANRPSPGNQDSLPYVIGPLMSTGC